MHRASPLSLSKPSYLSPIFIDFPYPLPILVPLDLYLPTYLITFSGFGQRRFSSFALANAIFFERSRVATQHNTLTYFYFQIPSYALNTIQAGQAGTFLPPLLLLLSPPFPIFLLLPHLSSATYTRQDKTRNEFSAEH